MFRFGLACRAFARFPSHGVPEQGLGNAVSYGYGVGMNTLIALADAMGRPTDVLSRSDASHVVVLDAGQAKTIPVPGGARVVLINATTDVWIRFGGPSAVPKADNNMGDAPELNPAARDVSDVPQIGLAAASAGIVNLVYYR